MNYRNRALLNLAHRLNKCPVCGQFSMHGLEPAHSDSQRHGKGTAIKAHDPFHAAMCHDCHGRLHGGGMDREEKQDMWQRAFEATLLAYWENGWLAVKGK